MSRERALRQGMATRALRPGLALGAALAILILAPSGDLSGLPSGAPMLSPSLTHPFGTDDLGRDLLAAVAQGARTSMLVGIGVTLLAQALGIAVGLAAGLGSPWIDELLMRGTEVVASLPTLIIAILVAALFGGSTAALVLVLGLTRWPLLARLVRAEAACLRNREFVLAARALGASSVRIAAVHVLPHVATVALAAAGIVFGGALVSEAALAFLGLGDPSVTSLGQLAANGFAFVHHAPWMWFAPAAAIVLLTGTVAILADRPAAATPFRD
jgi:peptide/nickel transport system permease protein